MKRILLLAMAIIIVPCCPVVAADVIKVHAGVSMWAREDGSRMQGPIIDLATRIFTELGLEVESKNLPWQRAVDYLKHGELDVMLVVFFTKERAEFIEFSKPYANVPTSVFVPKGTAFPFAKPEDLIGKKGIMVRGDSLGKEFDAILPRLNMAEVHSIDLIVRMLANGRADYGVYGKYAILIKARELSLADQIEVLPTPISSGELYFGFSKRSVFLKYLQEVNRKIEQFKEDGTIDKMIEQALDEASR